MVLVDIKIFSMYDAICSVGGSRFWITADLNCTFGCILYGMNQKLYSI